VLEPPPPTNSELLEVIGKWKGSLQWR